MDTVIEVFGLTGEKGSTEVRLCSCISWDKVLKIWSLLFQDVNWSTVLWFWKKQLLWEHCHVIAKIWSHWCWYLSETRFWACPIQLGNSFALQKLLFSKMQSRTNSCHSSFPQMLLPLGEKKALPLFSSKRKVIIAAGQLELYIQTKFL